MVKKEVPEKRPTDRQFLAQLVVKKMHPDKAPSEMVKDTKTGTTSQHNQPGAMQPLAHPLAQTKKDKHRQQRLRLNAPVAATRGILPLVSLKGSILMLQLK